MNRTITNFLIVLMVFATIGILHADEGEHFAKKADTHFMNEDGNTVDGVRCATRDVSVEEAEAIEAEVQRWIDENGVTSTEMITTIPIAFHILRDNNGNFDVTDTQIDDQVAVLNAAFANTNFQFSLASIDRTNNTTWSSGSQEATFKAALAIDPTTTLNFYTGNLSGGLLGWAWFPSDWPEGSTMHGVVCLYSSLPGGTAVPYNEGDTGTHEVGHYMGLYHTFQSGCSGQGDFVDDTNAEAAPRFGCPIGAVSCGSVDPVENFMDYTDDDCMNHFTQGQSDRMDAQIAAFRPTLLNNSGGGGDIPCADIDRFQARCNASGTLQMRVIFNTADHNGETVDFTINGTDVHTVTIGTNQRAQLSLPNYGVGTHTISLTDPAGCEDDWTVTCTVAATEADNFASSEAIPTSVVLENNYPNPFNPSTTLRFGIPSDDFVTLKIYNALGQEVTTLVEGQKTAGYHEVQWDGTNALGQKASTGMYIYRLKAGNVVKSGQMMFSK